jgi:hypothetical protein
VEIEYPSRKYRSVPKEQDPELKYLTRRGRSIFGLGKVKSRIKL